MAAAAEDLAAEVAAFMEVAVGSVEEEAGLEAADFMEAAVGSAAVGSVVVEAVLAVARVAASGAGGLEVETLEEVLVAELAVVNSEAVVLAVADSIAAE